MADEKGKKRVPKHNDLSAAAAKLGAAGGKVGGPARSAALSHEEKVKIASEGGKARSAKSRAAKSKITRKKKGGK
jgi:hypothetical protein